MSEQHTPGPWCESVTELEGTPSYGITIVGNDDEIICDLYEHEGSHFTRFKDDAANAAFIVRACNSHHDMLDALQAQEMREAGLTPPWNADGSGHRCEWCADCVQRIARMRRGAIAKATGAA